jgi:hypothetical protein
VTKFDAPKQSLSGLGADAVAALLSASADVVLVLDAHGVIQDVSSSNGLLNQARDATNWLGKSWLDTVTVESKSKIERLLKEADNDGRVSWRQVNVPTVDGPDLPISFCALRVGPKGRTIALGRDLRSAAELQSVTICDCVISNRVTEFCLI